MSKLEQLADPGIKNMMGGDLLLRVHDETLNVLLHLDLIKDVVFERRWIAPIDLEDEISRGRGVSKGRVLRTWFNNPSYHESNRSSGEWEKHGDQYFMVPLEDQNPEVWRLALPANRTDPMAQLERIRSVDVIEALASYLQTRTK